jgi:valyl-tRNA synthetase
VLDENQLKVGRRLATKLLNASRFVLGLSLVDAEVTAPLDRSMLARLSTVVGQSTRALEGYDHTAAMLATEAEFWAFCDDYIELVKDRAYAGDPSARAALGRALDVLLRLFAPFLPYVTEEVWSWWRPGSVHRADWPTTEGLEGGDPAVLTAVSSVLAEVRKAKTGRSLSMRAEIPQVEVAAPAEVLAQLSRAADDLQAAGRIAKLTFSESATLTVHCVF